MHYLKKIFNSSNHLSLIEITELLLLFLLVICSTIYFSYTNILNGDEREHLTASFYIYKGLTPYKDFFEHHHPLLWYIFAPFLILFNNTEYIWYILRTFSLILIMINSFYIHKICYLILKNKYFSILSICLSLAPHCVFLSQTEFRPDNLMITFFLIGIYHYFLAIKNQSQKKLTISFIYFTLSFLTLQKALIHLLPYILTTLYLLHKQIIRTKDFLHSLFIPFIIFITYTIYLYQTNTLKDYFELNWLLNLKISLDIHYPIHHTPYYYISNILALYHLFNKNYFLKYISFYGLLTSFILQFIFLGAYRHYWLPIYPYFAIVCAYTIITLTTKLRTVTLFIIFLTILNNNIVWYKNNKKFPPLSSFVYLSKQILSQSSPDDLIIGNYSTLGGLRFDATGYYWFGRDYVAQLDYINFKRHEFPNLDTILKQHTPKIIATEIGLDCMTSTQKHTFNCKMRPTYNPEFLSSHYNNHGFIYIRKD